jgi:rRNA-processing protein FCF1
MEIVDENYIKYMHRFLFDIPNTLTQCPGV